MSYVLHKSIAEEGLFFQPLYLTLRKPWKQEDRILTSNWDLYDTRHTVFNPAKMSPKELETGYWRAYRDFYKWSSIFRAGSVHKQPLETIRHIVYAGGWKIFEPLWDWVIRVKRVANFLPLLEAVLDGFSSSIKKDHQEFQSKDFLLTNQEK